MRYSPSQVTVIVGTRTNPETFSRFVTTLFGYTSTSIGLIIVLNEADKRNVSIAYRAKNFFPETILLRNKSYKSFAHWNNDAVILSRKPLILYLNDDTALTFRWLDSMLEMMDETVGAVGKKLLNEDKTDQISEATGTCLLVRREDAWFDPSFTGYYYEDLELIERIGRSGRKIVIEKEHPIFHVGRGTSSLIPDMPELQERNRKKYTLLTNT